MEYNKLLQYFNNWIVEDREIVIVLVASNDGFWY